MTYVVTENCIKCKYTDCVDVCPVDCFHEGPNFLVIDPRRCIDCNLCMPICPASAIFPDSEVPDNMIQYVNLNDRLSTKWPVIKAKKAPPEDADTWNGVEDKLPYLSYD